MVIKRNLERLSRKAGARLRTRYIGTILVLETQISQIPAQENVSENILEPVNSLLKGFVLFSAKTASSIGVEVTPNGCRYLM